MKGDCAKTARKSSAAKPWRPPAALEVIDLKGRPRDEGRSTGEKRGAGRDLYRPEFTAPRGEVGLQGTIGGQGPVPLFLSPAQRKNLKDEEGGA